MKCQQQQISVFSFTFTFSFQYIQRMEQLSINLHWKLIQKLFMFMTLIFKNYYSYHSFYSYFFFHDFVFFSVLKNLLASSKENTGWREFFRCNKALMWVNPSGFPRNFTPSYLYKNRGSLYIDNSKETYSNGNSHSKNIRLSSNLLKQ